MIFISGVLLLAADLETYLASTIFWSKMALVGALLVNGAFLVRVERVALAGGDRRMVAYAPSGGAQLVAVVPDNLVGGGAAKRGVICGE